MHLAVFAKQLIKGIDDCIENAFQRMNHNYLSISNDYG